VSRRAPTARRPAAASPAPAPRWPGRRPGRRPRRPVLLLLGAVGLVVFLAVSFELARWLSTENQERGEVVALLQAQARGDTRAMLARLDGCARDPRCSAEAAANARRLRRPGVVKILAYESKTAYALGHARGPTRVAWAVLDRGLPVVQCVDVERRGTVLTGRAISLHRLSPPIDRQAAC